MKSSPLTRKTPLKRSGTDKPLRSKSGLNKVSKKNSARRKDPAIKKAIKDSKAGGACALCQAEGYLEGHHILTRGAYPEMVEVPENIIPLCKPCHDFVTTHPRSAALAIDATFPGLQDRLRLMAMGKRK